MYIYVHFKAGSKKKESLVAIVKGLTFGDTVTVTKKQVLMKIYEWPE